MIAIITLTGWVAVGSAQTTDTPLKQASVFYPPPLVQRARANVRAYAWARKARDQIVQAAQPWLGFADDELWGLMFGNTITRSWMVWSNGHCPSCQAGVPMYTWRINALGEPWKVRCPHCNEHFPKNDFGAFYRSGLDEQGVFDPKRADRSLLFNAEHPDLGDPLRASGVDDGEGYQEGEKRWRFIGAYLIYGQWKQAVLGGIKALVEAYVVTGDPAYAHKALVLLDRVADLYPTFDFQREGLVYEGPGAAGYVSTWHDACEETRELALAYDQVFPALAQDKALVAFLSQKARDLRLDNPKASPVDIQRNIEAGILRDAITNRHKIHSNYPRTEVAMAVLKTVLDWPASRDEVNAIIDAMVNQATAVDGVTGEKGLAGYAAYTIQGLAVMLEEYARLDPGFLPGLFERHPRLRETYRFHIDTLCLGRYYPLSGDTGSFAHPMDEYVGVPLGKTPPLAGSMYSLLWRLYDLTGDAAYVQVLYKGNGGKTAGLPHDLFAEQPRVFQRRVREVIERQSAEPKLPSVNKQEWRLGILRSGEGREARAAWLDYDAGGGHGHLDGMNLGLFAKGLDLLPDFGYPPVQYGGWSGPRFSWYVITAGHNTVVVDGTSQPAGAGRTTLWADGEQLHALRASAPELTGGPQFERTVALVDVSDRDCYLIDLFRVAGGTDHAKFLHSHFGTITTQGLALQPAAEYGYGTQMRSFATDPKPQPGWSVDWAIEDRYKLLPPGSQVHLRYTDLTTDAQASTAEAWVVAGLYNSQEEVWIPRVMVRRQSRQAPLASTFIGVLEPYEGAPGIAEVRRLPLETPDGQPYPESNVCLEVRLADGRRDVFIAADAENPLGLMPTAQGNVLVEPASGLRLDGELCWVRFSPTGEVQRVALASSRSAVVAGREYRADEGADSTEKEAGSW